MALPPTRDEIAGTPTNAEAKAGFGKLWDYVTGSLGLTGDAIKTDASGNVGIGVTPSASWASTVKAIEVGSWGEIASSGTSGNCEVLNNAIQSTNAGAFVYKNDGPATRYALALGLHQWYTAASGTAGDAISFTQAMTLDASGNFMVGATSALGKMTIVQGASSNTDTLVLKSPNASGAGSQPGIQFWRDTNAVLAKFFADTNTGALITEVNGAERARIDSSGNLLTGTDNTQTLGSASKRWSTVYAGTGTINTSDAREKTPIKKLTDSEIKAAKEIGKEIGIYQFLSSVAEKGDKARHHVGMTVQRAIQILEANGLTADDYGFICYDKWDDEFLEHPAVEAKDAVFNEEGKVVESAVEAKEAWTEQTQKAGDRYGFRYDQLMMFIAAGFEARLSEMESK